ncbi:MAG TPA: radical SAM protein [Elusimicrobiota bacterium]|nr:radical SAM protein [Elusimicrobiota bacterium]
MQISVHDTGLTFLSDEGAVYTADGSGRLVYAHRGGWFYTRGLSGEIVAKKWSGPERIIRPASPREAADILESFRDLSKNASPGMVLNNQSSPSSPLSDDDIFQWIDRARRYDPDADAGKFRMTYQPVGILPPDQYLTVVLQLTEGCRWNNCLFCSFHKGQRFHLKTTDEYNRHLLSVREFLGRGLSTRNSIFIGEANGLPLPADEMAHIVSLSRKALEKELTGYRGLYCFMEPNSSPIKTREDFIRLKEAGVTRIYFGLETGSAELRKTIGKAGTLEEERRTMNAAQAAGISIGVIILLGIGGKEWEDRHISETLSSMQGIRPGPKDLVYLSPLFVDEGGPYARWEKTAGATRLSYPEMILQGHRLRNGCPPHFHLSIYDTREFIY